MMKKKIIIIVLIMLLAVFGRVAAFADDGEFLMKLRVVRGFENKSYTFSSDTQKEVVCTAEYEYAPIHDYHHLTKTNELHVAVYKNEKRFFGLFKKWVEVKDYQCTYRVDLEAFRLREKITLSAGEYGFFIWRPTIDTFWDSDGQPIEELWVRGQVRFE